MPIIDVTLIEGYDETVRADLSHRLTNAVRAAIDAVPDGITIVLNEVPAANYMRGGRNRRPGVPPPNPCEVVRAYLNAVEARDFDSARAFLADGFTMTFPGGVVFHTLEELIEWAKPRYRSVRKSFDRFEEAPGEDGVAVYCCGTLCGELPDGAPFSGIRFIDRFLISGGKILDQRVWNDFAEDIRNRSRAKDATRN